MERNRMNEKFSNENQSVKDLYDSMISTGQNDGRYAENTFVDRLVKLTKTPWGLSKRHRVIDAKKKRINNRNKIRKNNRKATLVRLPKQIDTQITEEKKRSLVYSFHPDLSHKDNVMIRSKRDAGQQQDDSDEESQDNTGANSDQEDGQTEQNGRDVQG